MKSLLAVLLAPALLLLPAVAPRAAEPAPFEAVSTLSVETAIEVDAQGAVTGLTMVTPLPEPMRASFDARVRQWKFTPVIVDGVAQPAKAKLFVALSARKQVEGGFVVQVDHASVADVATAAGPLPVAPKHVDYVDVTPPKYPASVLRHGHVPARVMLAVLVDAEGRPTQVLPVQSTLVDVTEVTRNTPKILEQFERTAVQGARRWRFKVIPGATAPTPDDLTVFVPVGFGPHRPERTEDGAWLQQVRTPRIAPPWLSGLGNPATWEPTRKLAAHGPLELVDKVDGTQL